MTTLISGPTRLSAWLDAAELLLHGEELNVILSIASPDSDGVSAVPARAITDAFYASEGAHPLHTVAETIFPGWEYWHRGLQGMFATYAAEYETMRKADPRRWGTYAHRLLCRQTPTGGIVNPLETLIDKMRNEHHQEGRGTYRACYEVGIAAAEYDLPLYSVVKDQTRRRGLPCLSHLSFKLYHGCVHLTALYRSHDYRNKALGNLLGLARLQACVAQEVGVQVGSLVVHSTYAYVDTTKRKGPFRKLVADLRALAPKNNNHELASRVC